jgi:hypothetical protein
MARVRATAMQRKRDGQPASDSYRAKYKPLPVWKERGLLVSICETSPLRGAIVITSNMVSRALAGRRSASKRAFDLVARALRARARPCAKQISPSGPEHGRALQADSVKRRSKTQSVIWIDGHPARQSAPQPSASHREKALRSGCAMAAYCSDRCGRGGAAVRPVASVHAGLARLELRIPAVY